MRTSAPTRCAAAPRLATMRLATMRHERRTRAAWREAMKPIEASVRAYEDWLTDELGSDLVVADLDEKHDKMNESAFVFLRATYWRWAESAPEFCGALM